MVCQADLDAIPAVPHNFPWPAQEQVLLHPEQDDEKQQQQQQQQRQRHKHKHKQKKKHPQAQDPEGPHAKMMVEAIRSPSRSFANSGTAPSPDIKLSSSSSSGNLLRTGQKVAPKRLSIGNGSAGSACSTSNSHSHSSHRSRHQKGKLSPEGVRAYVSSALDIARRGTNNHDDDNGNRNTNSSSKSNKPFNVQQEFKTKQSTRSIRNSLIDVDGLLSLPSKSPKRGTSQKKRGQQLKKSAPSSSSLDGKRRLNRSNASCPSSLVDLGEKRNTKNSNSNPNPNPNPLAPTRSFGPLRRIKKAPKRSSTESSIFSSIGSFAPSQPENDDNDGVASSSSVNGQTRKQNLSLSSHFSNTARAADADLCATSTAGTSAGGERLPRRGSLASFRAVLGSSTSSLQRSSRHTTSSSSSSLRRLFSRKNSSTSLNVSSHSSIGSKSKHNQVWGETNRRGSNGSLASLRRSKSARNQSWAELTKPYGDTSSARLNASWSVSAASNTTESPAPIRRISANHSWTGRPLRQSRAASMSDLPRTMKRSPMGGQSVACHNASFAIPGPPGPPPEDGTPKLSNGRRGLLQKRPLGTNPHNASGANMLDWRRFSPMVNVIDDHQQNQHHHDHSAVHPSAPSQSPAEFRATATAMNPKVAAGFDGLLDEIEEEVHVVEPKARFFRRNSANMSNHSADRPRTPKTKRLKPKRQLSQRSLPSKPSLSHDSDDADDASERSLVRSISKKIGSLRRSLHDTPKWRKDPFYNIEAYDDDECGEDLSQNLLDSNVDYQQPISGGWDNASMLSSASSESLRDPDDDRSHKNINGMHVANKSTSSIDSSSLDSFFGSSSHGSLDIGADEEKEEEQTEMISVYENVSVMSSIVEVESPGTKDGTSTDASNKSSNSAKLNKRLQGVKLRPLVKSSFSAAHSESSECTSMMSTIKEGVSPRPADGEDDDEGEDNDDKDKDTTNQEGLELAFEEENLDMDSFHGERTWEVGKPLSTRSPRNLSLENDLFVTPVVTPTPGLTSSAPITDSDDRRPDLKGFLSHLAVVNDIRDLATTPRLLPKRPVIASALDSTQHKYAKFQRMFHVKCSVLKFTEASTDEEHAIQRQSLMEEYDLQPEDVDLVIEHVGLSQEEGTEIRWDLIETIIYPDTDQQDPLKPSSPSSSHVQNIQFISNFDDSSEVSCDSYPSMAGESYDELTIEEPYDEEMEEVSVEEESVEEETIVEETVCGEIDEKTIEGTIYEEEIIEEDDDDDDDDDDDSEFEEVECIDDSERQDLTIHEEVESFFSMSFRGIGKSKSRDDNSCYASVAGSSITMSVHDWVDRKEQYQRMVLDLYEQTESNLASSATDEKRPRRQRLTEVLQLSNGREHHLSNVSLDDLSAIVFHVRLCRETDAPIQWDMISKLVYDQASEHSRYVFINDKETDGSKHTVTNHTDGTDRIEDEEREDQLTTTDDLSTEKETHRHPLVVGEAHQQAIMHSLESCFGLTKTEQDVVLNQVNMCKQMGKPLHWDTVVDMLFPSDGASTTTRSTSDTRKIREDGNGTIRSKSKSEKKEKKSKKSKTTTKSQKEIKDSMKKKKKKKSKIVHT